MYYLPLINEDEEVEINLQEIKQEPKQEIKQKQNCMQYFMSLFTNKKYSG